MSRTTRKREKERNIEIVNVSVTSEKSEKVLQEPVEQSEEKGEEEDFDTTLNHPNRRVGSDYLHSLGLPKWYRSPNTRIDYLPTNRDQRGVFATEDFSAGEILEEVPFINIDFHYEGRKMAHFLKSNPEIGSQNYNSQLSLAKLFKLRSAQEYVFNWSKEPQESHKQGIPQTMFEHNFSVLPLGNGCLYNSTPVPNTEWYVTEDSFIFRTIKKIKKGEEIRTYYGYFLTERGNRITAAKVLGLYTELNNDEKLCLRVVTKGTTSTSKEKCEEINKRCQKGDVLINNLKFYTDEKKLAAELRADQCSSTDFFYEKLVAARIQTNYVYVDIELQYTTENNKKEILTLYSSREAFNIKEGKSYE